MLRYREKGKGENNFSWRDYCILKCACKNIYEDKFQFSRKGIESFAILTILLITIPELLITGFWKVVFQKLSMLHLIFLLYASIWTLENKCRFLKWLYSCLKVYAHYLLKIFANLKETIFTFNCGSKTIILQLFLLTMKLQSLCGQVIPLAAR